MASTIRLNKKIEILPDSPLPSLDERAYMVKTSERGKAEMYAVICRRGLPPRADILPTLSQFDHPGIVPVVDWGVVNWPQDGGERFAIVFEQPPGPVLVARNAASWPKLNEDQVVYGIIAPLHAALKELNGRGISHGAVRPDNIWFSKSGNGGAILGDCVTTPPGWSQKSIHESLERAMADPVARGNGSIRDDIFALGVTAALLLLGENPVYGIEEARQIEARSHRGTYSVLLDNLRLHSGLVELMRGLLNDHPSERWGLNDLEEWLNGRRLSPKQKQFGRRAKRPLEFGNREYDNFRDLATAFSKAVPEAVRMIDDGRLESWMNRSSGDEEAAARVTEGIKTASVVGRVGAFEDRLVARVITALDPVGPIRYRGMRIMPHGLGYAMAEAVLEGKSPQMLGEIISAQLPLFWVNSQPDMQQEYVALIKQFDELRTVLQKAAPGYGIERCTYELAPGMPCASNLIGDRYIATPQDLLLALDAIADAGIKRRELPMDRHIAAFLATRDRRIPDALLQSLAADDAQGEKMLAILSIFTLIQKRHGPESTPGLARWLAEFGKPMLEKFHHRPLREKLLKALSKSAQEGKLSEMLDMLDDANLLRQDGEGFNAARRRYQALTHRQKQLQGLIANRRNVEIKAGREGAMAIAALFGVVVIGLLLMSRILAMV